MIAWLISYWSLISDAMFNLLLTLFGAGVPSASGWAYWRFRTKPPFRKVFQISQKAIITCIIPSVKFPDYDQPEYITFATPLESVFFFRTFLKFAAKIGVKRENIQVCLSEMASEAELNNNLFCLGGPIHNRISKALLQTIEDQVRFNGYDLECVELGKTYSAQIEDSRIIKDVALLVLAPNPWNQEVQMTLLAGCRGYASMAVFDYICDTGIRKLAQHRRRNGSQRLFAVFSAQIHHVSNVTTRYGAIKLEEAWIA